MPIDPTMVVYQYSALMKIPVDHWESVKLITAGAAIEIDKQVAIGREGHID